MCAYSALGGVLALLAQARAGPVPPPGFTLAAEHCIGDPTIASDVALAAPQQLESKKQACPGSAGDSCFDGASKACLADDTCSAFAYLLRGTDMAQ